MDCNVAYHVFNIAMLQLALRQFCYMKPSCPMIGAAIVPNEQWYFVAMRWPLLVAYHSFVVTA